MSGMAWSCASALFVFAAACTAVASSEGLRFGNGILSCRADGNGFRVTDVRTGREWRPAVCSNTVDVVERFREPNGDIRVTAVDRKRKMSWQIVYSIEKDRPEVIVRVEGKGPMNAALDSPVAFAARKGDRLIIPLNEGISYPADEPDAIPERLYAYSGHGMSMAFFGVQDDDNGAGWMAILETPDDASVVAKREVGTGLWTIGPGWTSQRKAFGYARTVRYVFFATGGYVAMCKRYRAHARKIGRFRPFREKAKVRPLVDRLLGAVNIWSWESGIWFAKELKTAGIDRFLWSNGGDDVNQVRHLAALPNVLVGRYDVYQDVNHPDQIRKLGIKNAVNADAWPKDIMWSSANSNDWTKAWGMKAKDGTWTYCARMCDIVSPAYARRKITDDLKRLPFNARFIDCAFAGQWRECCNPAHPMTRTDSRRSRVELLGVVGDEFGLVAGSETGHDAGVPVCDYFEGMMSLVPYRVPDSGRNIGQIWTNAPPRVAKYQTGEAYRLPLWELVYHECVCAHWYWGDYNNKLPELWAKRDLFNMLYGTMGMFVLNKKKWIADKDRFVRSYRLTSPIARATGYSEMVDHRMLSPDRTVQESRFADGTVVTVNFGKNPCLLPDGRRIEGGGHHVKIGGKR